MTSKEDYKTNNRRLATVGSKKRLSIDDRLTILKRLNSGEKATRLAEEYNISNGSILRIKKSGEELQRKRDILQMTHKNDDSWKSKKRCTNIEGSKLEQSLYNWFLQKRSIGDPVTGPMLKEKALEFNTLLNGSSNFKASNGFLDKFKKRHDIRCIRIHGEKLSADKGVNDKFCQDFLQYVREKQIPLDTIYNADETGLNWKMLPNRTLVSHTELAAPERKAREDRVTLMMCTNASGTHKLPLLVVGKYKKSCFKNVHSLPVIYMSQNNAWMDKNLMLRWY
ncbi:PREDICTED: jerky protein homolog-like [Trachymyrmex cornetzi]|uniref:jerky protein homolog-like n=1 Tax=Trachymyrmex cornetzi TaxID=471704 RepID=UPI00084ED601|nr:PREDICTED: jerky protein homolog-like [Trachymyrmex cornetzi]